MVSSEDGVNRKREQYNDRGFVPRSVHVFSLLHNMGVGCLGVARDRREEQSDAFFFTRLKRVFPIVKML